MIRNSIGKEYEAKLNKEIDSFVTNFSKSYKLFPWKSFDKLHNIRGLKNEVIVVDGRKFTLSDLCIQVKTIHIRLQRRVKKSYFDFVIRDFQKDLKNIGSEDKREGAKSCYSDTLMTFTAIKKELETDFNFCISALKATNKYMKDGVRVSESKEEDNEDTIREDRKTAVSVLMQYLNDNCDSFKVTTSEKEKYINGEETVVKDSLMVELPEGEDINKLCEDINLDLQEVGASVTKNGYNTAILQMDADKEEPEEEVPEENPEDQTVTDTTPEEAPTEDIAVDNQEIAPELTSQESEETTMTDLEMKDYIIECLEELAFGEEVTEGVSEKFASIKNSVKSKVASFKKDRTDKKYDQAIAEIKSAQDDINNLMNDIMEIKDNQKEYIAATKEANQIIATLVTAMPANSESEVVKLRNAKEKNDENLRKDVNDQIDILTGFIKDTYNSMSCATTACDKLIDASKQNKKIMEAEARKATAAKYESAIKDLYEKCAAGEITMEEREDLIYDLKTNKFFEESVGDGTHGGGTKKTQYDFLVKTLYEKCAKGEITEAQREDLISKAHDYVYTEGLVGALASGIVNAIKGGNSGDTEIKTDNDSMKVNDDANNIDKAMNDLGKGISNMQIKTS